MGLFLAFDQDDFVFKVDAKATDYNCLVLVNLENLSGTTQVDRILDVLDLLREGCDLLANCRVYLALDNVKLLPCFFVELQIKLLLA